MNQRLNDKEAYAIMGLIRCAQELRRTIHPDSAKWSLISDAIKVGIDLLLDENQTTGKATR